MRGSSRLARDGSAWERAIAHVAGRAEGGPVDDPPPVTLHFHPDRLVGGIPVIDAMVRDGLYRSQFETGTSNGGLTAHPGGDRWRWESRIFAGAYDHAAAEQRPKYGSLNFRRRAVGGSPRFGSCHVRLSPAVLERTTFCHPDSVFEPTDFGVAQRLSALIDTARADRRDPLDDYIEAHVHGPLDLARDVEAIVLDPSYRGTNVERAATGLACRIEWHPGFSLRTEELRRHPDYRGQQYVDLGLSLAEHGRLTPRTLGDAARTGHHDQQALKRVWHYVARFGNLDPAA
ncbi:uncharacterized protein DUF3626 [Saccharopolyspora erythraea NRRL 2338]|uniref:DUF3626 domain-containing protein n=1 Tax=Saccharopolyspora erythraea TaxID=1836 RepID=A0ABN1CTI6_SACER|nr:uncharacterized protein DUF3626 [Saccharopolyspora erythraea NRRL 2338]